MRFTLQRKERNTILEYQKNEFLFHTSIDIPSFTIIITDKSREKNNYYQFNYARQTSYIYINRNIRLYSSILRFPTIL